MSELCLSCTSKTHFSCLLKSDLFLFSSFILSHPLYFSYFIFFSPYILKFLFFVSPLFITTTLFLLSFLSISPSFINDSTSNHSSEIKVSFLTATYHAIVEKLRSEIDNQEVEALRLEDFEVFRIVFENPTIHDAIVSQVEVFEAELTDSSFQASAEAPVLACFGHQDFSLSPNEALASHVELDGFAELQTNWGEEMEDEKISGSLWQESYEFENVKVTTSVEKKRIEPSCTEADKAIEKQGEKLLVRNGSEGADNKIRHNSVGKENGRENKSKLVKVHSHSIGASADYTNDNKDYSLRVQSSPSLDYDIGSYGSMRKQQKEWKRTLACKLFEERNNADESEGMDLLWETYEVESTKSKANSKTNKNKKKNKKKYEIKHQEEEGIDHDRLQGEEEEVSDGQLCCLQALKFSTGKMNLGMGRPNLVKISKAIKGIGWLHNLGRHSKKVHNGDKY